MKSFSKILKFIFPKYWKNMAGNILFTFPYIVFGLFSFTMVIPFLDVLFGQQEVIDTAVPFAFEKEAITHNFYYYMGQVVIEHGQASALLYVSIFCLVSVLLKNLFFYLSRYVMPPLYSGVIYDIRNELYTKILKLPIGYYSDERKGDLMSRMTNDMSEIEASVMRSLEAMFKEPMTIIVYMSTLIMLSPKLTIFVLILLPIVGVVIGGIGKSLKKKSSKAQNKLGDVLSLIEESLTGLKIIKGFNAESRMVNKFKEENRFYRWITIRIMRRRDLASPLSEVLGTVAVVLVLYYGGSMVLDDDPTLSAGGLIGFIVIFTQILSPAKTFSTAYYNIQKGIASIERIEKVLDAEVTIGDKENPKSLPSFNDNIHYNNVHFKYNSDWVLKGIDLKINKGETVALVGQSGSGKTTMAFLLPRFYDVVDGGISIDGVDLRDAKAKELRDLMGIVNQESILFNDTIFNNIAFGVGNATEADVIEAAKIANAHSFIMDTPEGYQTNIGDQGSKMSGGQRQRLSIARAILANPPIMILDEATSALDTESEKLVQESLNKLMENRTSIVIAHRLSTIVNADKICVMQDGEIVEQGNHEELISKGGYYKKLHDTQVFS